MPGKDENHSRHRRPASYQKKTRPSWDPFKPAETFSGERRYSGSSIGYQLASLIGGGPTPVITAMLFMHDHSGYGVAGYVLLCSLVSVVAVSLLEERGHPDVPEGIQP